MRCLAGAPFARRVNSRAARSFCAQSKRLPCNLSAPRSAVLLNCMTPSQSSYFNVLDVSESASLDEIKTAFRTKSKLLHPDVNKAPTATRDFMLLRRAYTTLSTAELRAEYEAKLGMPSARAADPRFARFERWRREVIPDLRIQLDVWGRGLEGYLAAWRSSLEQREQTLARLYRACWESLQQLQQLRSAATTEQQLQPPLDAFQRYPPPPPPPPSQQQQPVQHQQQQPQQRPQPQQQAQMDYGVFPEEAAASVTFAAAADSLEGVSGGGGGGGGNGGGSRGGGSRTAQDLLEAAEAALRDMAAEVVGFTEDSGDGVARVEREVEKRYQQVSMRYPAYPDIVWMDLWEETSEQWLAQSAAEAQRCAEAGTRWSGRLQQLQERLQAATPPELHGQVAGAGTGRFNAV